MRLYTRVLILLLFTHLLAWLFQLEVIDNATAKPVGNTLFLSPPDSTNTDSTKHSTLRYPFTGDDNLFYLGGQNKSNFFLQDPKNLHKK